MEIETKVSLWNCLIGFEAIVLSLFGIFSLMDGSIFTPINLGYAIGFGLLLFTGLLPLYFWSAVFEVSNDIGNKIVHIIKRE